MQILDRALADWEEAAPRGLEVAYMVDSFLGGHVEAIKDLELPDE